MTYSIYVFLDEKNRPYYVGKTNNIQRRKKEHKEAILNGDKLPKYYKARSLISKGIPFTMKTIRTTTIEKEAWKLERYFIRKFRSDGYKLYNCTYGGPDESPMRINNPIKPNQKGINVETIKISKIKKKSNKIIRNVILTKIKNKKKRR